MTGNYKATAFFSFSNSFSFIRFGDKMADLNVMTQSQIMQSFIVFKDEENIKKLSYDCGNSGYTIRSDTKQWNPLKQKGSSGVRQAQWLRTAWSWRPWRVRTLQVIFLSKCLSCCFDGLFSLSRKEDAIRHITWSLLVGATNFTQKLTEVICDNYLSLPFTQEQIQAFNFPLKQQTRCFRVSLCLDWSCDHCWSELSCFVPFGPLITGHLHIYDRNVLNSWWLIVSRRAQDDGK